MRTIHKYTLIPLGVTHVMPALVRIDLPAFPKVIRIAFQHGDLCIWAEVTRAPLMPCDFYIVGTGQPLDPPEGFFYVTSIEDNSGVWHIYTHKHFNL